MKKTKPSSSLRDSDFLAAAEHENYLYLTTRGRISGQLREIEIWFTYRKPHLYVIAEYETSKWVQNLRADPRVRVRVASRNFDARARILNFDTDAAVCRSVSDISRMKYGWGDGLIVELAIQGTGRRD